MNKDEMVKDICSSLDEMDDLMGKLDTFIWAWRVNERKERRGMVNVKKSREELFEAYDVFCRAQDYKKKEIRNAEVEMSESFWKYVKK